MAEPSRRDDSSASELLALVFARPRQALARARAVLAGSPSDRDASFAHQAIGIVHREFGDVAAAIVHLRSAVRAARRTGSAEREADVLATLGIALVQAGRPEPGLAALDRAVALSSSKVRASEPSHHSDRGQAAARVRFRRGGALWILGRYREALADVTRAVPVLRRGDDPVWTARALNVRALIHAALGSADRADADLREAEELFAGTKQEHDSALMVHNRGLIAFRSGDLPAALARLAEADRRFQHLGTPNFGLNLDRSEVLRAAGLAQEALAEADAALARLDRLRGQATRRAQLLLAAAEAAFVGGDAGTAVARARLAVRMFDEQGRPWWRARAQLLLLQASFARSGASARLLAQSTQVGQDLAAAGSTEATQAYLLAGRLALALGRSGEAHLAIAARARHKGPALTRLTGWLAEALQSSGNHRRLIAACARGLDVLDEHRLTLGGAELRARAGAYGEELATLAQRALVSRGRELLRWSERGRSAALAAPPVRPPDDPAVRRGLTAFREVSGRLADAEARGEPAEALRHERERLERDLRALTHQTAGVGRAHGTAWLDVTALLDRLGDGRLVELVQLDGVLHALVCGSGRVRRFEVGPVALAASEVDFARTGLRRLAYSGPADGSRLALLEATAQRLEAALLGPAVRHLGDSEVVLVPPGRLHGVPWALLPSLRHRVHSVSPSATAWLRARRKAPAERVALVRGPGLRTGGAEVPILAAAYKSATVLENGTATAARVLAAMEGSSLAHIAAHGTFRADSPLFSSLRLDDGPLTVHDVARLRQAPYRLVLPSCDSGQLGSVGADDLLGLAAALLPLGTAGIVASLLPVNDEATVELMLALHDRLRSGAPMAQALLDARAGGPADPVHRATGWSFVAIGPA